MLFLAAMDLVREFAARKLREMQLAGGAKNSAESRQF